VPAIFVTLVDLRAPPDAAHLLTSGCACRANGEAAITAAILEAVQTRATVIAGTRDDLFYRHYQDQNENLNKARIAKFNSITAAGRVPPSMLPSDGNAKVSFSDVARRIEERASGSVLHCDLTIVPEIVSAVRVIVPGLEGVPDHRYYSPGKRARSVSQDER
jgi:ribosomal protein S12 methylthiotransferase accessory factor